MSRPLVHLPTTLTASYHRQLTALRATTLSSLANSLGVVSTGRKSDIAQHICVSLFAGPFPRIPPPRALTRAGQKDVGNGDDKGGEGGTRILSIDMGIRNLAICLLEIPHSQSERTEIIPRVLAWQRITISGYSPTCSPRHTVRDEDYDELMDESPPPPVEPPPDTTDPDALVIDDSPPLSPPSGPLQKESFTPSTFSAIAYALTKHLLATHRPHQIIIESQRYRTRGSFAVLEWTLRVNMFESLLWGSLRTLAGEGIWSSYLHPPGGAGSDSNVDPGMERRGECTVHAINPTKLQHFWQEWLNAKDSEEVSFVYKNLGLTDTKAMFQGKSPKMALLRGFMYGSGGAPSTPGGGVRWVPEPRIFTLGTKEAVAAAELFAPTLKVGRVEKQKKAAQMEEEESDEDDSGEDFESALQILPKRGQKKPTKGKLDDLADCLLQGLAWVKWEESRRKLLAGKEVGGVKLLSEAEEEEILKDWEEENAVGDLKATKKPKRNAKAKRTTKSEKA